MRLRRRFQEVLHHILKLRIFRRVCLAFLGVSHATHYRHLTAMTGIDPEASRSPTGHVCAARAGVRPRSAKLFLGRDFDRQISPIKGQIVIYRTGLGSRAPGVAVCATVAGNRGEPSGESRLNGGVA